MKRELSLGSMVHKWIVIREPETDNGKLKVTLRCTCGKISVMDVRTVNRAAFSKACRGCSQIERHNTYGRVFDVGDKFMNLEILKIYPGSPTTYQVKCLNCMNIYHTGHSTLHKKKMNRGLYACHRCFDPSAKSKKKHTMCTTHISLTLYKTLHRQSEVRGVEFSVTPEYLEQIYDGFCYLSGLPITLGTHIRRGDTVDYGTASLDRINSNLGYVENNVAWCYKQINVMKHIMSKDEFIALCNTISAYNNAKQEQLP